MWSKEEIDILMSNIERYVKVSHILNLSSYLPSWRPDSSDSLFWNTISGPRHRRPGRDHLWDVQRGEEGFLPLGGSGVKPAAVRRLQTSPENVRQPQPRRQVSVRGKDVGKETSLRIITCVVFFKVHAGRDWEAEIVSKTSLLIIKIKIIKIILKW